LTKTRTANYWAASALALLDHNNGIVVTKKGDAEQEATNTQPEQNNDTEKLEVESDTQASRLQNNPHSIRAEDILFRINQPTLVEPNATTAINAFDLRLKMHQGETPSEVTGMFHSSKTNRRGTGKSEQFSVTRDTEGETTLVTMLWKWAWCGNYSHPLDLFLQSPK